MRLVDLIGKSTLPTRVWMDQRFPKVDEFATKARRHLRGIEPWCAIEGRVPPVMGTAMDYRIRYAFAITPIDEFVAFKGAMGLPAEFGPMPVFNLDLNRWLTFDELAARGIGDSAESLIPSWLTDPDADGPGSNFVGEFFSRLSRRVPELAPVNRWLAPVEEDELDRYCILLALLEQVARAGMVWPSSILDQCTRETTCDAVLASFPKSWLDDMAGLTAMFYKPWAYYLGRPSILNPRFRLIPGSGVDGDLIVDGVLVELKTYQSILFPGTIRQLLAYVLLDTDDAYGIAGMGIYMVRHGRLIAWRLEEALDSLAGPGRASLAELRAGFRDHIDRLVGNARIVGADGPRRPSIPSGPPT
jgi:hypothetical protein